MTLFMVVALPPPVQGHAVINAAVAAHAQFRSPRETRVIDTSPGTSTRGFAYHLMRARRVLDAIRQIAGRSSATVGVYTVVEAGWGLLYNFVVVGTARARRARIYLHHHTSLHTKRRRPGFAALAKLAGTEAIHIALSERMAYDLRLLYPAAGRIMVSHNAGYIDPPTTVPEEKRPNRRLRVGLISNLDREKGLDLAIETVEAALAAGTDLELWLAGPFSSETARHRFDAAKVRLGDRLDWLGPVAGARKHDFFQSIDVLLFPTQYRYEAQPLVVLEAMAFGLPVVTTDRGYIEELVGKGFALSPDPSRFVPAASVRLAQLAGREDVGSATRQRYDALRRVALAQRTALLDILYADRAAMSAHAPAPALNEPG